MISSGKLAAPAASYVRDRLEQLDYAGEILRIDGRFYDLDMNDYGPDHYRLTITSTSRRATTPPTTRAGTRTRGWSAREFRGRLPK